jgi:hypothetical protein
MNNLNVCSAHSYLYPRSRLKHGYVDPTVHSRHHELLDSYKIFILSSDNGYFPHSRKFIISSVTHINFSGLDFTCNTVGVL